jgi:hypothetical protein
MVWRSLSLDGRVITAHRVDSVLRAYPNRAARADRRRTVHCASNGHRAMLVVR